MRIPVIQGLIKRRLLVNYRADPEVVRPLLPVPFRPKLRHDYAIVGVCLIRLEQVRPRGLPAFLGIASENAAHRFAVEWTDADGSHEGVFVPRRDTGSWLNHWAGGRVFPGEHALAKFSVADAGGRIDFTMTSRDGGSIHVRGEESNDWPADSVFANIDEASAFFERGYLGYSVTKDPNRLDGLRLHIPDWRVQPFSVDEITSSYFNDEHRFPAGSVTFDHALLMRNVRHEWHEAASPKAWVQERCRALVAG